MSVAIDIQRLSRTFGAVTAVSGLSLGIAKGELFGLVGPDGAGKTTTLRMLAGILTPSAGDALVAGCSVRREPERLKDRIAYMSQRFGLYGDLTVLENLDFYADVFEVPLAFFLDPANHHVHSRTWQGRERRYYAMPYGERYVWGATAGMLKNLWRILSDAAE